MFKAGDNLAEAGKDTLKAAGLTLEKVAAARKKALEKVRQAMLDTKQKPALCETCKLVGPKGEKRQLQMPTGKAGNGSWDTPGGVQPANGNGTFRFTAPKTLPDGRKVDGIEFKDGSPVFDDYVVGGKHELWEVSGDAATDAGRLTKMKQTVSTWEPPDDEWYVPRVIHDKRYGGVGHTGGNSMTNNKFF